MLFPPEPEEQDTVNARQLPAPMELGVTAAAQRDLPRRFFRSWPAMVNHERSLRQTELATAISPQHLLPETAKTAAGVTASIVTPSAETLCEEYRVAARAAPPGLLPHSAASLPCSEEHRTRIQASGKPLSSAASTSWRSSHAEPSVPSAGQSQTPEKSKARSADATTSASSGRWILYKELMRAWRTASAGEGGWKRVRERGMA